MLGKVERIPTTRGSTFFRGDNSINQLDCRKFFRLYIVPPSGDPALVNGAISLVSMVLTFTILII